MTLAASDFAGGGIGFHADDFVAQATQACEHVAVPTAQVADPRFRREVFLRPVIVDLEAVIIQPRELNAYSIEQGARVTAGMSRSIVVRVVRRDFVEAGDLIPVRTWVDLPKVTSTTTVDGIRGRMIRSPPIARNDHPWNHRRMAQETLDLLRVGKCHLGVQSRETEPKRSEPLSEYAWRTGPPKKSPCVDLRSSRKQYTRLASAMWSPTYSSCPT
jgi:hypothetical protein